MSEDRYRTTIETALEAGHLWALMNNGRYWRIRRNGQTKTWKTDPYRFEIPIKAGMYSTGTLTNKSYVSEGCRGREYVLSVNDPNVKNIWDAQPGATGGGV